MPSITSASTGITGSPGGGITGSGSGGLSAQQELALAYAAAQAKHKSFLSDVLSGTGSALGTGFSYLMRPSAAVASGAYEGAKANPGGGFHIKAFSAALGGAWAGLSGKEHKTFSDTIRLKYPHFAGHHKVVTALGGLSLDVLTDPTLPLVIGSNLIPGVGAAADVQLGAKLAADLGRGKDAVDNYTKATAAYQSLKDLGEGFKHRKVLADLEARKALADIQGKAIGEPDMLTLNMAQGEAKREAAREGQRLFQARYSIPFTRGASIPLTPLSIAGRRVAPKVPSLSRTAEGAGVLSHIPGMVPAANAVGKVFKHGFNTEEFSKPSLQAAKLTERLRDQYMKKANETVFRPFKDLTFEQHIKALEYGETHPDIVTGSNRALNVDMLQKAVDHGELSPQEGKFLAAWHEHMNFMDVKNKEFGLAYEKELGNKVYVPHQFQRDGGIVTVGALRGPFGATLKRETDLSIKQIIDSNAVHDLNLETSPFNIMFHYSTKAATAQSKSVLMRYITQAAGVVDRVPNEAKNARIVEAIAHYEKKMESVPMLGNMRGRRISITRQVQERWKRKTAAEFSRAQSRMLPHDLAALEHVGNYYEGAGVKNVPSFSNARKGSRDWLRNQIDHLPAPEKAQLVKLHQLMTRHRLLANKLANLPKKRGGPAKAERALAEEVGNLQKDIAALGGKSLADVEALGKDFSREKIGYQAQPQGRQYEGVKETKKASLGEQYRPQKRDATWRKNLTLTLQSHDTSLKAAWKEIKDKYPTTPNVDNLAAAQRALKARDRIAERLATRVEAINEDARIFHAKLEAEFEHDFNRHSASYERLLKKRDYAITRLGTHFKNNPDIPEGWRRLEQSIDGKHYYFPPEMHAAMTRLEKVYSNDTAMQSFENTARKLISSWKLGVTSINPGYRVRNTVSDLWNNYIAGVPTPQQAIHGARAAKFLVDVKRAGEKMIQGEPLTKKEQWATGRLAEMYNHSILSGLFAGDVQRGAKILQHGNKWRDIIGPNPKDWAKFYLQAAQDINRNVENWGRITHYFYRRDYQRLSAADSADWVKKANFDYTELSTIEQEKFKLWMPFYTWTRKDIPYQLSQLASRPGKYATYAKVARTSNELATGDPYAADNQPDTLPSFYRDNFAFRVPGFGQEGYYVPNIGIQDLAKVTHPTKLLSLANPAITVPYEVATGISAFTGQPLQGNHPRNPISGWSASLLSHVPGTNVGPTARNVRGEKVTGAGASPWVGFIASQLPLTNYLVNQSSTIKQAQRGGGGLSKLNYLGGLSVYNRDLPTEATAASLEFQKKMQRLTRGLRDIGALPEAKAGGTSAYQQKLQAILNG